MLRHVDLFCVLWYLIKNILYLELGLFTINGYKKRVINERVLGGVGGGRWRRWRKGEGEEERRGRKWRIVKGEGMEEV